MEPGAHNGAQPALPRYAVPGGRRVSAWNTVRAEGEAHFPAQPRSRFLSPVQPRVHL
ncbi:hypothetical protein Ssi03_43480 [Sphaerisporangium siamense]|nr:hypothetical protein Ssi03_43480 [Sphaerisporangium siamense]